MSFTKTTKLIGVLAAAGLLLTACGSDGTEQESVTDASAEEVAPVEESASEPQEGDDGRAFDSTDEAVIIAIETALSDKNAKARWDGSRLKVELDGSVDDPTATLWCTAVNGVISDAEQGTLIYADGEILCDEQ